MTDLVSSGRSSVRSTARAVSTGRLGLDRRTARTLLETERRTIGRLAAVRAEALVTTEKVREVGTVGREAMNNYAFVSRWRDHLASGDPMLADELRFLSDTVRLGMGEVIADLVDTYCRESRG